MIKKYIVACLLCISTVITSTKNSSIKAIFIDIETLFETHDMKASKYIGKIDALRYLKQVGHLPNQNDLFKNLTGVSAQSTLTTYNNKLVMPLILSDWLLNVEPTTHLLKKSLLFIEKSRLSDIEKRVLSNIIKMMMDPAKLVDTQQVVSTTEKLIKLLISNGYKVYLVGNWAHKNSLQKEFHKTLQSLHGIYLSGQLHLIKPYQEFYNTVLEKTAFDTNQSIWIEKEAYFTNKAKSYGFQALTYNKHSIIQDLKALQIKI